MDMSGECLLISRVSGWFKEVWRNVGRRWLTGENLRGNNQASSNGTDGNIGKQHQQFGGSAALAKQCSELSTTWQQNNIY